MARIPERTVGAAREMVMVVLAALLEMVEWVEPEMEMLREAAVVGWSLATSVMEVYSQWAA